ncbi:hypothetical protein HI853_10710, partial [Cyanobacteria bacterium 150SLHA]
MHRLAAITAALLMPVVIDSALIAEAAQEIPEVLIAESKSTEKEELGIDDIDRLIEEASRAQDDGLYGNAITLLNQILVLEKKFLGEEHQDVGGTLVSIGSIYQEQRLYREAEINILRGLGIIREALGLEHSETFDNISILIEMYEESEQFGKAESMLLKTLKANTGTSKASIILKGLTLLKLSSLMLIQMRIVEAEAYAHRLLAIPKVKSASEFSKEAGVTLLDLKFLGYYSLSLLNSLDYSDKNTIDWSYIDPENYGSKSIMLAQKLLAGASDLYGEDYYQADIYADYLVDLYSRFSGYDKAEEVLLDLLNYKKQNLGIDHPSTHETLRSLAEFYSDWLAETTNKEPLDRLLLAWPSGKNKDQDIEMINLSRLNLRYLFTFIDGIIENELLRLLDVDLKEDIT